uniref:Aryl hydrocarbon receptor n=3 Tax=Culex pipiens TaxID=7175 RepID=A0A8D8PHQ1_CULPI
MSYFGQCWNTLKESTVVLKTGASGMIAYRYQKKGVEWQWLQTSSRLVYKNSKPDFIICTHRQLMEEEGRDLLGKRTMDFKVSYLDTGLTSTYFTDADQLISTTCGSPSTSPLTSQQRYNRRYKTHLRDFLSTCRTKRKHGQQSSENQDPGKKINKAHLKKMKTKTLNISNVYDYCEYYFLTKSP